MDYSSLMKNILLNGLFIRYRSRAKLLSGNLTSFHFSPKVVASLVFLRMDVPPASISQGKEMITAMYIPFSSGCGKHVIVTGESA